MTSYNEYKASGIEWIGKIPLNWKINRIKNIVDIFGRIGFRGYTIDDIVFDEEGAISLSPSNIIEQKLNLENTTLISLDKYEESPEIKVLNEDVVLVKTASIGKAAMVKGLNTKATINPQLVVFKNYKLNKSFFYYLMISDVIQRQIFENTAGGVIGTITQEKISNYKCVIPPLIEQISIVGYLDEQTQKIDKLISNKKEQIERLKELRQIEIDNAVTKGLNPNVKLKESGIDWLGKIPIHWKLNRLKNITYMQSGNSIISENISDYDEYPVYGGNGLRGYTNKFTHEGEYILIGRQGALCGNINYAIGKFWASEHAVVVTPIKKLDYYWLGELLNAMNLNRHSQAAAQPGLAVEKIQVLKIPLPDLQEQNEITVHLKERTSKIDKLILNIDNQILKLQELRKIKIYQAVTGKIKVTANEPTA